MGLRFGLVGAGLAGPLFGGALAERPRGAELRAVATRHEASSCSFAERYGVAIWYCDWRDLVADPAIDVVCFATLTGIHSECVMAESKDGKEVLREIQ